MAKLARLSGKTRGNWLIDAAVFASGLGAAISGVYFLFIPSGGYQGGRNPWYGVTVVFTRHTWDDVHTWAGVAMIVAAVVHFSIHWAWVKTMARRVWQSLGPGRVKVSEGARVNLNVDIVIALSFLLTAVSGIYFLFVPAGGYQGGANPAWDPGFLFSRTTWDLIHTWAGTIMIIAAVIHFVIHWGWVTKVTRRFVKSLVPQPTGKPALETIRQGNKENSTW